jgi:hypothetical protein
MKQLSRIAGLTLLLALPLLAQNVESLALPDALDSRSTPLRLAARIAELNREATVQASLGNTTFAATILQTVSALQSWQSGAIAIPPALNLEAHAVTFYEGAVTGGPGAPRTARINVTRGGVPIVLYLNAYESIDWTIDPLPPGVQISQIVLVSYDPQTINGVPAGTIVTQIDQNTGGTYYGGADELEGRAEITVQTALTYGVVPSTITGSYTAPSSALEIGAGDQEWLDQWVLSQALAYGQQYNVLTFGGLLSVYLNQPFVPLLTRPIQSFFGQTTVVLATPVGVVQPIATLSGSISNYDLAPGNNIFVLDNRTPSTFDPFTFSATPIPPDPTLPAFSFVCAQTFDSLRTRLLVASFGGGGTLYAYDLITSTWSVLTTFSFFNSAPSAMAYHSSYDAVFGVTTGFFGSGNFELKRYSPVSGAVQATFTLGLETWGDIIDGFQLYVLGANLALVGPAKDFSGLKVRHSFVIDPTNGDILFAGYLLG